MRICGKIALALVPVLARAAGEGGEALVLVADSRVCSGWNAWTANLYNDSHVGFALLTIVIIPALGLLVGALAGCFMARLGINLKSRVLAEH
jgi:hypothetical protein